ncbi:MAG: DUF2971 domain-containing protein [Cyclobacteriaceae bacterium]
MRKLEKEVPYPKIIYKYSKINEFLFQQMTNNELWFSNPQDFNDPYDCNIGFNKRKYTEAEVREFWAEKEIGADKKEERIKEWMADPSKIEKFLAEPIKNLLREKGVTCFTSKNDSILMWSHYANSHKGVCLGFSSEALTKSFYQHEWVTYASEFPPTNMLKVSEFVSTIMCIKSDFWKYEDEIRIFQKEKGAYIFPKEALKEIIFGLNSPLKQIQSVMNMMHQLGYTGVQFKQVILRNNEFKIHFASLKYEPKTHSVLKLGASEDSEKITFSILNPYWEAKKGKKGEVVEKKIDEKR